MIEATKKKIKITFWKKPNLDGYEIEVPINATDYEINNEVGKFMESELMDTWEWEEGEVVKEYVINISRFGREP